MNETIEKLKMCFNISQEEAEKYYKRFSTEECK